MYNEHYTHQDLTRAITDKTMSNIQRYAILAYFGYTPHEIQQVYHNLAIADSQEEEIKQKVETIVNTTINSIFNKF